VKDPLTKEEREYVEHARENLCIPQALGIIDRLAPRPKEFSWAPGHTRFGDACEAIGVSYPDIMAEILRHILSQHYGLHVLKAVHVGFVEYSVTINNCITPKGRAWLADYEAWRAEGGK
jgi:hypothetical protein